MPANPDVLTWLRNECDGYSFDVSALFTRDGDHAWPLTAANPDDLDAQLRQGGHFLALPKEPAALANVIEVSIVKFLEERAATEPNLSFRRGTERGYPDIELAGEKFGGGFHAIDVKVARRKILKDGSTNQTQSRITLYTGNTYFAYPELLWPGMFRPFGEYESHVDIIVLYTLDENALERATDIEVVIHEPWRIASRDRSSTTREYIGAVKRLDDIRNGISEFETEEEFYKYWRKFEFRVTKAVQQQLRKLIAAQKRSN